MFSRTDSSPLSEWWWTIDRTLLGAVLTLVFGGLVLSLAASPPVAQRLGVDSFFFVRRHAFYIVLAVVMLVVASLMTPRQMRRSALAVYLGGMALMVLTLFVGTEVKGATRWISFAGVTVQPSEFVKPAFVVLVAWLFAERERRPDMPANLMAIALLIAFVALLVPQPDFGQTVLAILVWGALFFAAGMPWLWIVVLGGLGAGGLAAAYTMIAHVRYRIDRFLNPDSGDTFQVDTAKESFVQGGWLGRGPGEGSVKLSLPDSHTDFIFAVAGEEFGVVMCLMLLLLFAFIVLRVLAHALSQTDAFARLAVTGLIVLFGLQASINMMVNLSLMPAKGMTLPFVSYGGSSLIALSFTIGMVIGLTRRRPQAAPVAVTPMPAGARGA